MREQNNTNNKNSTKNISSKPPGLPNELPIRILKREDFPERSPAIQETSPRLMVNTVQSGTTSPTRSTSPMNTNNRVSVQILANKAVNIPKEYLPSSPIRSESNVNRSPSPTKANSALNPNAAHFVPTKETMLVQPQATRYQVPISNAYPTIPPMYKSYFGASQRPVPDKVLTWNKFYFSDIFGNWRTNQSPIAF